MRSRRKESALRHLEHAQAAQRDIQVAFGRNGGGGGGGGGANAGRDLANLFDLELDTEKNQYEQQPQGGRPRPRSSRRKSTMPWRSWMSCAKRQQELAQQPRNAKPQTMEQRYEQDSCGSRPRS